MKNVKLRRFCAFLLCVITLFVAASSFVQAVPDESRKIRVGFFAFDGYHNMEEDGSRSGYGYEYLQQIARYTGWSYDYIGYDKSWSDAQKMLENGEIDILTSAQKTPEREEIFDFSDDPIGYSSTIFTIKAGNNKYTIDNFAAFDGIKVGMIEGNSRNAEFDAFSKEKGFTYVPVMFDDTDDLTKALQDETIDSIVTSSLRSANGEWIVAEFGFSPYYVCVKKGNTELLAKVNDAISRLNKERPGLQNELKNKYYGADSSEAVAFTEQERTYISKFKADGRKLKVIINPDRAPLSFFKDGKATGLFGDVALEVLKRSGLEYEFIETADRTEYKEYRISHKADLCADMRLDYSRAEDEGYRQTDAYYSASISRLTKEDFSGEVKTVAAVKNSDIAERLFGLVYGDVDIEYYTTIKECLDAVKNGRQDATYLYTYTAEEAMRENFTHHLTATLVPDFSTSFCMGIGDTSDSVLYSIINKSVNSLDQSWLDAKTVAYTEQNADGISFTELLYYNPIASIFVVGAFLALICALLLMLYRQRVRKKGEESAKEIQRLFSYVCRANESVMEVNLRTLMCKEYSYADNTLSVVEKPYKTEGNHDKFMNDEDYENVVGLLDKEQMDKLIKSAGEYVFEARGKGKDGEYRWYIFTICGLVPSAKHPYCFMLFKRNINDLKVKEEESRKALTDALHVAQDASEAKGTFMSRMSHEIRTPLNAVIGYLTLSSDVLDNPAKVGDYIEKCKSAARHLLNIINDVLDVSAIESGKLRIANEPFDLKELLSTISLMFYNQAKKKNVEFAVEIDEMTNETVVGDSLRLNQILMNLLSNAMKFTPEGGTVRLSVAELQTNDEQIRFRFEVSDTGIGMSKEFMARIFSPFEQEKAETAKKYGGSGLGLSITNNLVTMMRGSIKVDSEEGNGTTFTVHLAFSKAKPEQIRSGRKGDFSKIRALIVDDESRSCDYMKALLKRCDVRSDIVLSGEAAVKQIMKRKGTDYEYNLCLIDWNMPGINGVETARRIREDCGADMPIIIASAYDISEIRDAATKAGVNKLISKPLFQSTMFDLLVDTFGKYEPLQGKDGKEKSADFAGTHVLLAEDNEMNREIAVSILKKSGLVIDTAEDGKKALEMFTSSDEDTYKVILMDVQMPVMDGYESRRIPRQRPYR